MSKETHIIHITYLKKKKKEEIIAKKSFISDWIYILLPYFEKYIKFNLQLI